MKKTIYICLAALCSVMMLEMITAETASAQKRLLSRRSEQPYIRVKSNEINYDATKDRVSADITVDINRIDIEKRGQLRIMPYLTKGAEEYLMPPIVLNGTIRNRLVARHEALTHDVDSVYVSIRTRGEYTNTIDYHCEFQPEGWMNNMDLILLIEQCGCDGEFETVAEDLLNTGITIIGRPADIAFAGDVMFVEPPREAIKIRSESGQAHIVYVAGRADINQNLSNNVYELDKILKSIEYVRSESTANISGISVMSYASPEGSASSNLSLSQRRAGGVVTWLRSSGRLPAGAAIDARGMGEDWDGLLKLIKEDPGMSDYDKSNLEGIINTEPNFDKREQSLKAYNGGGLYRMMFQDFYPRLRRSDYKIDYTVPEFTLEKSMEVFKTRPDLLSQAELYAIASQYDRGTKEFNEVFQVMSRLYPDDKMANLNVAASYLASSDTASARRILENYENEPQAWMNLGNLSVMEGDLDKAQEYFAKAQSAGIPDAGKYLNYLSDYRSAKETYERDMMLWQKYGGK